MCLKSPVVSSRLFPMDMKAQVIILVYSRVCPRQEKELSTRAEVTPELCSPAGLLLHCVGWWHLVPGLSAHDLNSQPQVSSSIKQDSRSPSLSTSSLGIQAQ